VTTKKWEEKALSAVVDAAQSYETFSTDEVWDMLEKFGERSPRRTVGVWELGHQSCRGRADHHRDVLLQEKPSQRQSRTPGSYLAVGSVTIA
jgi:hypothetical protein